MAIVNCPECSKKLKVADTSLGKKVKCSCGTVFVAEAAEAPAAPSVAEKVLVACTECASKLKVAATSLGKKMKCPKCGGIFVAALAPETVKKPAPADDEEAPLNFAAAQAQGDDLEAEEEMPKPKAKPRKPPVDDEDEEEDGASEPAGKPVYPSRLLVNLLVFFLVIAYGAFFAVTHPDVDLLPLGLVKPRGMQPVLLHGGNPPDDAKKDNGGPPIPKKLMPKKDKGMKGPPKKTDDGKKVDDKKDDAKKDDGKKDDPKDDKQGRRMEPLREPIVEAVAFYSPLAVNARRHRQPDRVGF